MYSLLASTLAVRQKASAFAFEELTKHTFKLFPSPGAAISRGIKQLAFRFECVTFIGAERKRSYSMRFLFLKKISLFICLLLAGLSVAGGQTASPTTNPVIVWNRGLLMIVRTPGAQPATVHPTPSVVSPTSDPMAMLTPPEAACALKVCSYSPVSLIQ